MSKLTNSLLLAGGIFTGLSSNLMASDILLPLDTPLFRGEVNISSDLRSYFVAKAPSNTIVFDDVFGIENPKQLDGVDDYGVQYVNYGYSIEAIVAHKFESSNHALGNSGASITCSLFQCWIKNPDQFILGGPLAMELIRLMGKHSDDESFPTKSYQGPDLELVTRTLDESNQTKLSCRYSPSYFSKVVCKIVKGDKLF